MVMSPGKGITPIVQAGGGEAKSEVAADHLFLSHDFQDHLRRVYDGLRGAAPILSREQISSFLATTQKQHVDLPEREEYKFEEFLEILWYSNGLQVLKEKPPVDLDMSHPISHYFISSSHNTYLSGNQLSSKSSTEAYKNVLIRGCRCIEIDVWNGEAATDGAPQRPHIHSSISSHSISSSVSSVMKGAKEKIEHGRELGKQIMEKTGHHRIPSINSDANGHESVGTVSKIESNAIVEPLEKIPTGTFLLSRHNSGEGEPLERTTSGHFRPSRHNSASHMRPEPRVLHGWTLTSEVSFRDVCKAVRETAFLTTNLPIIVSLEVHADVEQQELMVEIMKEEWKGLLIDEAHPTCNPKERLPKLNELFGKILVKVKKATPIQHPAKLEPAQTSSSLAPPPSPSLTPTLTPSSTSNSLAPSKIENGDSGQSGSDDDRGGKKKKKSKICDSLGQLGIYTHSAHFTSFDQEEALHPPHVFSVSETQILELHHTKPAELFAHNRKYFMRAYPAGRRIDSSNPDPSLYWRRGVQMVALNWQSWDEGIMLNEAMFAGEHGWVLKPPAYLCPESTLEPVPAIRHVTLDLRVTIFAGQHIPLPLGREKDRDFHPYVKVELHVDKATGPPSEVGGRTKEGKWKLSTKHKKTDHPDWGAEGAVLNFQGVHNVIEDLSFLRIKIEDEKYAKDRLAAWACIKLDRLQEGYRLVKLMDAKGVATDGLLLVKVEKTIVSVADKSLLARAANLRIKAES